MTTATHEQHSEHLLAVMAHASTELEVLAESGWHPTSDQVETIERIAGFLRQYTADDDDDTTE